MPAPSTKKDALAQAGDEELEVGVDQMQRVIELARVIRDRTKKPLKQPLRQLTVVHPSERVLRSLTGDLAEYIYQETNVREMRTSNDPEQFGTVRAEPVFSVRFCAVTSSEHLFPPVCVVTGIEAACFKLQQGSPPARRASFPTQQRVKHVQHVEEDAHKLC